MPEMGNKLWQHNPHQFYRAAHMKMPLMNMFGAEGKTEDIRKYENSSSDY